VFRLPHAGLHQFGRFVLIAAYFSTTTTPNKPVLQFKSTFYFKKRFPLVLYFTSLQSKFKLQLTAKGNCFLELVLFCFVCKGLAKALNKGFG